jgi:hypothetical protein
VLLLLVVDLSTLIQFVALLFSVQQERTTSVNVHLNCYLMGVLSGDKPWEEE